MILDGRKGRKSAHDGVLGLGKVVNAGYYRLVGKPLMHMGEGEAGWDGTRGLLQAGNGGSSCLKAAFLGEPRANHRTSLRGWK